MLPGGVRRCIIPSKLAYEGLAKPYKNNLQVQECGGGVGPVPPEERADSTSMGAGEFQRFKNIYCNANRPYQPDLVLDGELYRSNNRHHTGHRPRSGAPQRQPPGHSTPPRTNAPPLSTPNSEVVRKKDVELRGSSTRGFV